MLQVHTFYLVMITWIEILPSCCFVLLCQDTQLTSDFSLENVFYLLPCPRESIIIRFETVRERILHLSGSKI